MRCHLRRHDACSSPGVLHCIAEFHKDTSNKLGPTRKSCILSTRVVPNRIASACSAIGTPKSLGLLRLSTRPTAMAHGVKTVHPALAFLTPEEAAFFQLSRDLLKQGHQMNEIEIRRVHAIYLKHQLTYNILTALVGRVGSWWSSRFRGIGLSGASMGHKGALTESQRCYLLRNPRFFSELDSDEKAWLLGFSFADAKPMSDGVQWTLAPKDVAILEAIRRYLGSEHPIKDVIATLKDPETGQKRGYRLKELRIYSARLAEDLAALNVVARRTELNLSMPHVPRSLRRAFTRGLIDGDGGICRDERVQDPLCGWRVSFSGSDNMLRWIEEYARGIGITAPARTRSGRSGMQKLEFQSAWAFRLLEDLYRPEDAAIALPRKYEIARNILNALAASYPAGWRNSTRQVYRSSGGRWGYLLD